MECGATAFVGTGGGKPGRADLGETEGDEDEEGKTSQTSTVNAVGSSLLLSPIRP